jgi:hypothetical protein
VTFQDSSALSSFARSALLNCQSLSSISIPRSLRTLFDDYAMVLNVRSDWLSIGGTDELGDSDSE